MTWHTRLGTDRAPPFSRRTERVVVLAAVAAIAAIVAAVLFGG